MQDVGLVLPAFLIGAGIACSTGIVSAAVGSFGHRVPLYLTFSVLCFAAAGYLYTSGQYYSAHTVAEATSALRWQVACVMVFLPFFYWFVALYTGRKRVEPWRSIIGTISAVILTLDLLSPHTIRFSHLEMAEPLRLPWGEVLSQFSGRLRPLAILAHATAWGILIWALWRASLLYRGGRRRAALLFGAYLVLQFCTAVQGLLIDLGLLRSFYAAGFGFLGLVLLMSMSLAMDLRDHNVALEAATSELRGEINRRREAEGRIRAQMEERESLESALHQSQKIQAMGVLAGGVAHDFNNLLTVMLGGADLGIQKVASISESRERFREIKAAALKAGELTQQLLSFSRSQVLRKRVIDVNRTIGEFTGMLTRVLGEEVRIRTNLEPDLPRVFGDPGQIQQVILNLATNARDAMPRGGSLVIATRAVPGERGAAHACAAEQPAARYGLVEPPVPDVVITVTDSGDGMDESTRARIFEPFYTTKEPGKGTGLGLAVVNGIVSQHGGRVAVRSEVGRGSTFEIRLPSARGDESATPPEAAELPPPAGETVLYVEDDAMVRDTTVRMLTGAGYRVVAAPNAEEGLRLFRRWGGAIDLVMTDVVMPGLGGPELCAQIRIERPHMPVLF
ncbi:MAG: response regulator, partial [Elusimicrobia bacterium]|nr:response regulator [Elusimicrobiota bacterium]